MYAHVFNNNTAIKDPVCLNLWLNNNMLVAAALFAVRNSILMEYFIAKYIVNAVCKTLRDIRAAAVFHKSELLRSIFRVSTKI